MKIEHKQQQQQQQCINDREIRNFLVNKILNLIKFF